MATTASTRRGPIGEATRTARLLIVEDEPGLRFSLAEFLSGSGFEVAESSSCEQALRVARDWLPDLVVMDYRLPDGDALTLLPRLRRAAPEVGVVLLTGHGTIELAVRAMKAGADHFFTKPVSLVELEATLRGLDERRRIERTRRAEERRESRQPLDPFLGTSSAIRGLAREAHRMADSRAPVLITGPTGSGKGVLAGWLHRHSRRAGEPFVDINCASLSREFLETELFGHERGAFTGAVAAKSGLLEVAHRGTLFLDEIGDLSPEIQPRLLKVLEEGRFRRLGSVEDREADVRILAATHHDLADRARRGLFREDLYFRIQTLPLRMPGLTERLEDLPRLAETIQRRLCAESGRPFVPLAADVLAALGGHDWPGNLRELRNVLERALLLSLDGSVAIEDLALRRTASGVPRWLPPSSNGSRVERTLQETERLTILAALQAHGHRVTEAAQVLGIPRSSLYQKMQRFGITPPRHRRPRQNGTEVNVTPRFRIPDFESRD